MTKKPEAARKIGVGPLVSTALLCEGEGVREAIYGSCGDWLWRLYCG